ncbi:MAG: S8 family serine peptidase [Verrucomicrobia bacterium]|nr:S8 family serine peptidase [Verrucomicrobiota bacterium]
MQFFLVLGFVVWILSPDALGQESSGSPSVRFEFREPRAAAYRVEKPADPVLARKSVPPKPGLLKAWLDSGSSSPSSVKLGNRVVLELRRSEDFADVTEGRALRVARTLTRTLYILEAPDSWTAVQEAESLSRDPRVMAAYPVAIRPKRFSGNYAAKPNDPFFYQLDKPNSEWQPYLENRDTNGAPLGIDLNVRAAWPISRGRGVVVAVGDDGVDLAHPDLAPQGETALHYDFYTARTNGMPAGAFANHGTAVAGLALAKGDNKIGISGVAPDARLASWVLFSDRDQLEVSDEALMDMFQYQSSVVAVQNHSWGKDGREQLRPTSLESLAISNAVTFGRQGRGVVMVRAGGNGRARSHDANDDGYLADPRVIAVAAVRLDGRVTRYSAPGANLLVAAPSGDADEDPSPCGKDSPNLLTTDRRGLAGFNSNTSEGDLADYGFGATGFSGTSAATPQISGLVALILGTNPKLTYRDVQQVLIHSARHVDLADPDVKTNRAGFRVSHNLGFGVPDAGLAVRLAKSWPNRPPATEVIYTWSSAAVIPDQGLRVLVRGKAVPANLQSIVALPALGVFPDTPTSSFPLVNAGTTSQGITADVRGRAALIQRGENYFCEKLSLAAAAGASLAIVYNNRDLTSRIIMGATEFTPIPGAFISQSDGEALRQYLLSDPSAQAQLALQATNFSFSVKETLLCEHVGVRIDTDHTVRGDLRITLVSPHGTRSVLQSWGGDDSAGPRDWTYYSVHNFYESSAGMWTVAVSDLDGRGVGSVRSIRLIVRGVPITDSDGDGLDDSWELQHFGNLAFGPQDDVDNDGFSNAREQIVGTVPGVSQTAFVLDLSRWNGRLARLSWPSTTNTSYEIRVGPDAARLQTLVTTLPGRFPETEWFVPYTNLVHQFFRVEAVPTNPSLR